MDVTASTKEVQKHVEIFCCYARKDQPFLLELRKHLSPLVREGLVTLWADTDINAGAEWKKEISLHLNTSRIILVLVSPDFMASDYCYSIEMQRALERRDRGEAHVIPIIVRPISWQGTPLSTLQALPKDAKPISIWPDQDEAFNDVSERLREVVEAERLRQPEEVRLAEQARLIEQERLYEVQGEEKQTNRVKQSDSEFELMPDVPISEIPDQRKVLRKPLLQVQTLIDQLVQPEPRMIQVPGVPKNLSRSILKKYRYLQGKVFEIGEYPVTNIEYQRFVAGGHSAPQYWKQGTFPPEKAIHPVAGVTRQEAEAYCAWLASQTGKQYRLPTPQEWEWAATGPQGHQYPWGEQFDQGRCNTKESGIGDTTPVNQYLSGKSFCGAKDMSGNVWEMTVQEIIVRNLSLSEVQQEASAFTISAYLALITAVIGGILVCWAIINLGGGQINVGSLFWGLFFGVGIGALVYYVSVIIFMFTLNVIISVVFYIIARSEPKPKSKCILRGGAWNTWGNQATCFSRKHWIDKSASGFRLMREL